MIFWIIYEKQENGQYAFVRLSYLGHDYMGPHGRLGNFLNGELYGRITDVPWGMIFPHAEMFSSSIVSSTALAAAHTNGPPPKVVP